MALFLSTFTKKIDKKGRVSVPAQFRTALNNESFGGIIVYPSFVNNCIEACGMSRIESLSDGIDSLDPFSEERDAFATAVLGGSSQLQFDSEGRVALPPELLADSGVDEEVVFIGKGQTFEIWEPKAFAVYAAKARKEALAKRDSLRLGRRKMHNPVMLKEVLHYLQPKDGEVYVDATFGAGGYTKAILASAKCKVIAIDQDPNAIPLAATIAAEHGENFKFVEGNFGDIAQLIKNPVDAIIFDIGVSSMQLDEAIRGFSFKRSGPLDMRMSQEGMTAAEFLNKSDEKQIADVIFQYGEERKSRHIAAEIVKSRPLETTADLANAVHRAIGNAGKTDSATKTFQAVRIFINSELENLQKGLKSALEILKKGGRLIVVSFHSLEDRIVKLFLQEKSGALQTINRHMIQTTTYATPEVNLLSKGAVKPSVQEMDTNPRARSAKLRAAIKIGGYHD